MLLKLKVLHAGSFVCLIWRVASLLRNSNTTDRRSLDFVASLMVYIIADIYNTSPDQRGYLEEFLKNFSEREVENGTNLYL